MMKLKIKKGDTVQVISGGDKGKKGEVLEVKPSKLMIKVKGVCIQTHYKKNEDLIKKEGFFNYSKVQLVESKKAKKSTKSEKRKTTSKSV